MQSNELQINKEDLLKDEIAYLLGVFVGDGSLYKSGRNTRFEFSDGSLVEEELKYSRQFLEKLSGILNQYFYVETVPFRKNNKYVIKFRKKSLVKIFGEYFEFKPGPKSKEIDIPSIYKETSFENSFWRGIMDADGMIARDARKITLWSASEKLIDSFRIFLQEEIPSAKRERKLREKRYFIAIIKSPFIEKYADLIGFDHPRKRKWLERHRGNKFYKSKKSYKVKNFLKENKIIDYFKIFQGNSRIFVKDCQGVLEKREIQTNRNNNVKFMRLSHELENSIENLKMLSNSCRWKMSKGSTKTIDLPLKYTDDLARILKFARIRESGIRLSRKYIQAYNESPGEIIDLCSKTFDISPSITSKGGVLFSSRVLYHFLKKLAVE